MAGQESKTIKITITKKEDGSFQFPAPEEMTIDFFHLRPIGTSTRFSVRLKVNKSLTVVIGEYEQFWEFDDHKDIRQYKFTIDGKFSCADDELGLYTYTHRVATFEVSLPIEELVEDCAT